MTSSATRSKSPVRYDVSLLTPEDLHLFNEGNHYRIFDKMGAHIVSLNGQKGTVFSVWAPNAREVSVIGDFNSWNPQTHLLRALDDSGIWQGFIPDVGQGAVYKYQISSRYNGHRGDKADPIAFSTQLPPATASCVWNLDYKWEDAEWMASRHQNNSLSAPISTYEVHLGSWMRIPEEGNRSLTYREMAPKLTEYVNRMQYTHVELLPIMEHPFYGSWGYQTTAYFAPTSRYGTPQDFMYLVDYLHQHGVGVILDWVPSHFPSDAHALAFFDGTHLYEHSDVRLGFHPDWNTYIFNYGRNEVRSFLLSSAMFWLDKYHVDGLRVDAVASMLYRDYSRKAGEWIPNQYGGRENLEAIELLRQFNQDTYKEHPDVQTIAEESTSWPMVSRPLYIGGLGFGMKWDMGWMHDTLAYFAYDPVFRAFHHSQLTFRMMYTYHENFVLPLSHDEVVYGKGSLINKMPGDERQKFANLRLLFAYMFSQPGKKLTFMGCEFAQWREWNHDASLDWDLTGRPLHRGMQAWVEQLNRIYRSEPGMHELEMQPSGFEWVDCNDSAQSTLSMLRIGNKPEDTLLIVCNFTPIIRNAYEVGVPNGGYWRELLNSDAAEFGGSGVGNMGGRRAEEHPVHGRPYSLRLVLPPLAALVLKRE